MWKAIPGHPDYEAHPDGRFRSWARGNKPKILTIKRDRYCYVGIRSRMMLCHRLLLLTFVGPPPFPGAQVRHLDGNPMNNALDNLAWGTAKENAADRDRHGTTNHRPTNYKLSREAVAEIKAAKVAKRGDGTIQRLAKKHGVNPSHISHIRKGKFWGSVDPAPTESLPASTIP